MKIVPGTELKEPFTLRRYKEESGFGYATITLYLLSELDLFEELRGIWMKSTMKCVGSSLVVIMKISLHLHSAQNYPQVPYLLKAKAIVHLKLITKTFLLIAQLAGVDIQSTKSRHMQIYALKLNKNLKIHTYPVPVQ